MINATQMENKSSTLKLEGHFAWVQNLGACLGGVGK